MLLASVFYARRSLGYLFDKKVEFSLSGQKVVFNSQLKYRYVTSRMEKLENSVSYLNRADEDVLVMESLEELTNRNLGYIFTRNQVLRQTKRYAELCAFLKWANNQPEEELFIDLSNLAQYPAYDIKGSPTPDLIIDRASRRKKSREI